MRSYVAALYGLFVLGIAAGLKSGQGGIPSLQTKIACSMDGTMPE
jgi:hypothetical protein